MKRRIIKILSAGILAITVVFCVSIRSVFARSEDFNKATVMNSGYIYSFMFDEYNENVYYRIDTNSIGALNFEFDK